MFTDNYCETADLSLAPTGHQKIEWVKSSMPVLSSIHRRFSAEKPLNGLDISISIHLEAKTAYFAHVLAAGGANVRVTGCNPLSTQDDVAAALADDGFCVNALHGASPAEYRRHLTRTLENKPQIIVDDGGDLVNILHEDRPDLAARVIAGCEETTTGVHRLRARSAAGKLQFPMIAVNDAGSKHLFDNRYGTGQSVWDGIMRNTNLIVASKTVVVAGYGDVGKGCSHSMRSYGARVLVTEIDPICALQAAMEGFEVTTMEEAVKEGNIFVTTTGNCDIITIEHMEQMKDQAIVCNIGHFDNEIQVDKLINYPGIKHLNIKPQVDKYTFPDGHAIFLLAEGRLVNLGCATGHSSFVMSNSFTNQVLAQMDLWQKPYEIGVYRLPKHLDEEVARLHLERIGVKLSTLTQKQADYIGVKIEGPYKADHYRY